MTRSSSNSVPGDDAKTAADLMPIFQQAWLDWSQRLLRSNQFPLSGNVDQWIKAWGESVGQVGLLNVNVVNSSDPHLEKQISGEFSYGRQLGRMLDMLGPLVEANQAVLTKKAGPKAVDDFQSMVKRIRDLKARSVADIVDDVRQWEDSPHFARDLAALISQLEALRKAKS